MKVGFCGMLGIVFIVLKLTGVIDWAWGWVLAPIWIPLLVFAVCIIIAKKADYDVNKIVRRMLNNNREQ